ncbi:MAG: hypothetical protein KAS38_10805, partial [Anaerolineales bacterium]|nr:hypothetical protein [Anaerolineales bacterium]
MSGLTVWELRGIINMLFLADVFEALTGIRPDWASQVITETCIDSRRVIPGAMFVSLSGERVDGHDFVSEAFRRGAKLSIIQRDLSSQFPVIDLIGKAEPPILQSQQEPFCLLVEDSLKALQLIARFYRRKLALRVIGITGSVGKSTTKELVAEVLEQRYRTLK